LPEQAAEAAGGLRRLRHLGPLERDEGDNIGGP
jgi:hypothetical protein